MENNQQISKKLLALNAFFLVAIVSMVFVIYNQEQESVAVKEEKKTPVVLDAFNNLNIEAKSAYVFDLSKNIAIFERNEEKQLPLASLTKLAMALTALRLVPKNSNITIKKEFLDGEGDTGLLVNESWKLKDLLDFSLMVSSNDGARSIASVVGALDLKTQDFDLGRKDFIQKMNDTVQKIGLKQTYFLNESGLDEGIVSGGYGSAEDVSKLMQYILKNNPSLLEATRYETANISSENMTHSAKNTNIDVSLIPGLIASKTGYTDLAGGNLAVAFDPSIEHPIIIVVLGSSEKGRFNDVAKLVKASLEYIRE